MRHRRRGLTTALIVAALALGACATDTEDGDASPGGTTPVDEPTEPVEPTEPTQPAEPPAELPGEPFDLAPEAGAELAVVGVAADDVLNVREAPGVEYAVVAELDPLATDVTATGEARQLDDGQVWVEVETGDGPGWANLSYLAYPGRVDDITSQLGDLPSGTDLVAVAEEVAEIRAPSAEGNPTVTVVDGPHEGDLAEIVVDVLGLADDSVLGERLHVFARVDGDRYTVRTVEAMALCARGVTDGLCL